MIIVTESQRRNSTKQHLYPSDHRHCFPHDPMSMNRNLPNFSVESFSDVELEVDTEDNLYNEHQHQPIRKSPMDIRCKDSPSMHVSHEITHNCQHSPKYLSWYMPSIPSYLLHTSVPFRVPQDVTLTPKTIPAGNIMPKVTIIMIIWAHSIVSYSSGQYPIPSSLFFTPRTKGSALMCFPSSMAAISWPCAETPLEKRKVAVARYWTTRLLKLAMFERCGWPSPERLHQLRTRSRALGPIRTFIVWYVYQPTILDWFVKLLLFLSSISGGCAVDKWEAGKYFDEAFRPDYLGA